ncbi:MAG: class I SAM-dependent methyltransferase [Bryobacteraceae bacterium]|nr:class I SAM-dependent methyltransferase [Bryobacteraceae bacterium]
MSERIPGWTRGREAFELANVSYLLPNHATIVEVGSFLGSSSLLLAGARQLRGNGLVHCVDPFDASGDPYSAPHYRNIAAELSATLRQQFDNNIRGAGLARYVTVHEGTAELVALQWDRPIDFLFLDGDHSPEGARLAFRCWTPFLNRGGIIALHNSAKRHYARGHDGFRRLVLGELHEPEFHGVYCVGTTTFATKQ